ncbi:TadG family pilus assembly protein [Neisseriaceae bacterium JH1-16]|nr:TadG family pilus assembly protein [Neisseriaceae bacterium JH1-16]
MRAADTPVVPRNQSGAVVVQVVIWLSLAVILLGSIDIGYVFMSRRELQRTADMAALAGVQLMDSTCTSPTADATANAMLQGFPRQAGDQITVTCGRWDPSQYAAPTYFSAQNSASSNAVQVHLQRSVPYFFVVGGSRVITADATAKVTNVDAFTLGTGVASLNQGLVNSLLNGLLGSNLNLSLVSYQGLADANINLSALATQLGVGTAQGLLATNIDIQDFVVAMAKVLQQTDTVDASVLQTIGLQIPRGMKINLGNTPTTPGLLQVDTVNPNSVLNASVNVLNALVVAAEIAQVGKAPVTVGTGLNLGGLATVNVQAAIIQPPVLAAGEPGLDASGNPRTSAHSAQVRLFLKISLLNDIPLGIPGLLSVNLSALNLPLALEVGQGTAWLQSMQCKSTAANCKAVINTTPGVAALCIGDDAASNLTNTTQPFGCKQAATVSQLSAQILLAVVPIAKIGFGNPGGLTLSVQPSSPTLMTFNGIVGDADDYQTTDSNAVGDLTSNLVNQLTTQLGNGALQVQLSVLPLGAVLGVAVSTIAGALLTTLSPILQSLFSLLNALLVPLLQLLGVQLGYSTVHNVSLTCGQGQLVF